MFKNITYKKLFEEVNKQKLFDKEKENKQNLSKKML